MSEYIKINLDQIEDNQLSSITLSALCQTSFPCVHTVFITYKDGRKYSVYTRTNYILKYYEHFTPDTKEHMLYLFGETKFLQDCAQECINYIVQTKNKKIEELLKEVETLKTMIKYQPDGEGYEMAKQEFEKYVNNTN